MFRLLTIALFVSAGLMLVFGIQSPSIAISATIPAPEVVPLSIQGTIDAYARLYGVSAKELYDILNCESGLNPQAEGDKENGQFTSFGISQIHLIAHPDITKAEALDYDFSIQFMAEQISKGNAQIWTCAKIMGYVK
jgi:hypothetical protein